MMGVVSETDLAYIGLGANVGATREALREAVAALAALPGASLLGVSRLYRTRPVGAVVQADFHNAAVGLQVSAGPDPERAGMDLLVALKGIERAMGRQERERWGPREMDLDLLLFGAHRLSVERDAAARSDDRARGGAQWLEVPHPAASERLFVLAPLAELAPDLVPPGWGMSVAAARDRAEAREGPAAVTVVADWDADLGDWVDASPR
jgi:2-amino-4-hydroxy-6-hydroxymethyldihydropteridine diphosphokinase